jgi:hypothetical protein
MCVAAACVAWLWRSRSQAIPSSLSGSRTKPTSWTSWGPCTLLLSPLGDWETAGCAMATATGWPQVRAARQWHPLGHMRSPRQPRSAHSKGPNTAARSARTCAGRDGRMHMHGVWPAVIPGQYMPCVGLTLTWGRCELRGGPWGALLVLVLVLDMCMAVLLQSCCRATRSTWWRTRRTRLYSPLHLPAWHASMPLACCTVRGRGTGQ